MASWNSSLIFDNLTFIHKTLLPEVRTNGTNTDSMYPLGWVIPVTVIYAVIFLTGLLGNISTCIVIVCNKTMHTATNYYLFSLAISDLLLLISGLPPEMYRIWSPDVYVFGQAICVIQGFAAETSANATVLTITAFTVERYVAICHPFLSHTIAKLSRIVKFIVAIWLVALCLAIPQAIQFGVAYDDKGGIQTSTCTVISENSFNHAFEISTFVFFIGPMTLITVLYVLIAFKLRQSRLLPNLGDPNCSDKRGNNESRISRNSRNSAAQNRVIKMLVAVVAAFFICWAPFHAQRLLAVYLSTASAEAQKTTLDLYIALMHISGVLYFLSTSINPVLYHIMSNKFRDAFKVTFGGRRIQRDAQTRTYSMLSRYPPSLRTFQRSVSDGVQNVETTVKHSPLHNSAPGSRRTSSTHFFRPRYHSQSSQATAVTNISKSISSDVKNKTEYVLISKPTARRPSAKRHKITPKSNKSFYDNCVNFLSMFNRFVKAESSAKNESVDNANTISNSSLQDMDEIEFSSSDLVRYMEEINENLS